MDSKCLAYTHDIWGKNLLLLHRVSFIVKQPPATCDECEYASTKQDNGYIWQKFDDSSVLNIATWNKNKQKDLRLLSKVINTFFSVLLLCGKLLALCANYSSCKFETFCFRKTHILPNWKIVSARLK